MANVFDVAAYILEKYGEMTAMRLQKLCYYSQAWSLAWEEEPLFNERIEAWINGPVVPRLYAAHRKQYRVSKLPHGNADNLTCEPKDTIDKIVSHYGQFNAQELSNITHMEAPWQIARRGLSENERGKSEIPLVTMGEYYASL